VPKLRFTDQAERDLVEIGHFIARDNPANAARFIDALQERCRLLASHPHLGRAREELGPELRSLSHGRYVIFYRAIEDGVVIIRFLHGARDLRRALRGG